MARRRKTTSEERRQRRKRIPVWIKAFWLIMAAVIALAVFSIVRKTVKPVGLCWQWHGEVVQQEKKLSELKRERRELQTKQRYLNSPAGAETEARKLGYVRPGEISIVLQDEDPDKKTEPERDATQ